MKQDVNNIDNLFREGLGGYTEVPPPDVWDALERRLDNDKKKRPFAWRWFFVMLCGIGLFGSLFAWKMNGHSGVTPDVADVSGIASIQQKAVAIQTTTPGNTSAGSAKTTAINSHKHHSKHVNELKNTYHNSPTNIHEGSTVSETAISANSIDNNVTATATKSKRNSILDNTAVAMANVEPEMKNSNNAPVRYVVNNKSRNNIVVAESEPTYSSNNYNAADESEEDNVTFGRKPKVNINEPEPRNTYATNARFEGIAVTNTNHIERRTTATGKSIRNNDSKPGKVSNDAVNNDQIASTTPHKKQIRRTNHSHQNNPYSITNDNSSIVTKPVATSTEKRDNEIVTDNTNNSIAKKSDAKIKDKSAGSNTTQTGIAKNTKRTEQPSKNEVTTAPTTKNAVKGTSIAAVAKAPVNKAAVTKKITNKKQLPTATNHQQNAELINKVATTTTEKYKRPTYVSVQHKNVVKKADSAIATNRLASGKNVKVKADVTSTQLVPTQLKATKRVSKNEGTQITNKVVATQPYANRRSSASSTTATKKNKKEQPISTDKTAAHQSDDVNNELTKKAEKNKKKTPKTKPTAIATTTIATKQKKDKKTTGKTETNNALSAALVTPKQPEQTAAVQTKNTPAQESQKVMSTFKEVPKPSMKPTDTAPLQVPAAATAGTDSPATKLKFGKFTYGVKAGYEGGFTHDASNKLVISPFIERRLSSKFSIMAQPAIKSSTARSNGLSGTQTFYKTDPNGTVTNVDSFLIPVIQNNQTTGYLLRINVAYHETHDSIVKSYATGGNYLEFELPILLKYSINDKLSIYGGVSLNYSKYIQIKENTYTAKAIVRNDTTFTIYPTAPAPISSVLQYTGNNINSYSGPLYPAQSGGLFRMGYMLGVSYEIRKRWLIDAMLQKAPAKTNILGGYDVNKGLSTSYFRLTLGYRLSK